MQLVEAGEVELDDPVSQYLGAFSGRPAGAVTIRQLLTHTSGWSTLQGNSSPAISPAAGTSSRSGGPLATMTPAHTPDVTWEYSDTNYEILGRVIEVVAGQETRPTSRPTSWNRWGWCTASSPTVRSMMHPWRPGTGPGRHQTTAAGEPDRGRNGPARWDHRERLRSGAVLMTMMNGRDDVLSAAGKALMMRPDGDRSPFYGFGWFVDPANGSVWHSGTSPGFESLARMLPARRGGSYVLRTTAAAGSGSERRAGWRRRPGPGTRPRLRRRKDPEGCAPERRAHRPACSCLSPPASAWSAASHRPRPGSAPVPPFSGCFKFIVPRCHARRGLGSPSASRAGCSSTPLGTGPSVGRPTCGHAMIQTAVTWVLSASFRVAVTLCAGAVRPTLKVRAVYRQFAHRGPNSFPSPDHRATAPPRPREPIYYTAARRRGHRCPRVVGQRGKNSPHIRHNRAPAPSSSPASARRNTGFVTIASLEAQPPPPRNQPSSPPTFPVLPLASTPSDRSHHSISRRVARPSTGTPRPQSSTLRGEGVDGGPSRRSWNQTWCELWPSRGSWSS